MDNNYGLASPAEQTLGVSTRKQTVRERLTWKKERLEKELASVNEALGLLDKSPDFEAIHDAITKAGY